MENVIYEENIKRNELSLELRHLLQKSNLPWLNSFEFCTQYVPHPAEFLLIKRNEVIIYDVVFYRLIKKRIGLRLVEIIGFPKITDEDVRKIIKTNSAHLAIVNRLEPAVKPDEEWHTNLKNVYCKSYITIAQLPENEETYFKLLGKNERKQLNNYLQKLYKHFGEAIEIRLEYAGDIKLEDVLQLEYLNRERRSKKGHGVDSLCDIQNRQQHRWSLTQSLGLLITFRHNGEIISGTLSYIYGNNASIIILAHNSEYDCFRVGKLSIWKTMTYLVEKGITDCNFLWGRNSFKTQFLGVEYPWSIHVITSASWLAVLGKNYIKFNEFGIRAGRYLKTKVFPFNTKDTKNQPQKSPKFVS